MTPPSKPLDIFRAGRHVTMDGEAIEYSAADLAASAQAYDPALSEAPLVVGHPKADHPAYGWVAGLSVEGDVLRAAPHQVNPDFAELVNAGSFKRISASFYRPDSAANPKPGVWYLRHVGFLGAVPPAVKGLRTPSFAAADDDQVVTVSFAAPELLPKPHKEEVTMTDKTADDLARKAAELDAREAKIKADEEAAKVKAAADLTSANASFVEGLVTGGKLPSELAARAKHVMGTLDATNAVEFGEGDAKKSLTPLAAFRELLDGLPKMVEFGEAAKDKDAKGAAVNFAAPTGYVVDRAGLELHSKARAYQKAHPETDYVAAVTAVTR